MGVWWAETAPKQARGGPGPQQQKRRRDMEGALDEDALERVPESKRPAAEAAGRHELKKDRLQDESFLGVVVALAQEGAYSKAVKHLLSEGIHELDPTVLAKLAGLHPAASPPTCPPLEAFPDIELEEEDDPGLDFYCKVLASFPRGSAPGPSGLRPGHLQELALAHGELAHKPLVAALAAFAIMGERGAFHRDAMMMFGSASLIPLKKPDGGVRPVAVGDTLRRFVAKVVAARPATKVVISALRPLQCGVSVPGAGLCPFNYTYGVKRCFKLCYLPSSCF